MDQTINNKHIALTNEAVKEEATISKDRVY